MDTNVMGATMHVGDSLGHPHTRKSLMIEAIAKTTGLAVPLLKRIELAMDQRVHYPLLGPFLMRRLVPSSSGIIIRLLMNSGRNNAKVQANRLFSEYRVVIKTSQGLLRITATMRVQGSKRFWRRELKGVICVRYRIEKNGAVHEYCQDFLLKGPHSLRLHQYGFSHNAQTAPSNLKLSTARQLLLTPASSIYL